VGEEMDIANNFQAIV